MDHVRVAALPLVMLVGFALKLAVGIGTGGGAGAVTVTVTADWADPVELLATSVYVVVAVGVTVRDPLAVGRAEPFSVYDVASDVDHVSVTDCPL